MKMNDQVSYDNKGLEGGDGPLVAYLLHEHSIFTLIKIHWLIFIGFVVYFYVKFFLRGKTYPITRRQRMCFFIAIILLTFLKATFLDVIGAYYLFSVHVLQISFICFIVIPLMILSIPHTFLRQHIWHYRTQFVFTLFSHPWLSLILFNGLLTIYLLPTVFTFLQSVPFVQSLYQILLVLLATFMWFVIIQPVREFQRVNPLLRAVYIFLASLILMPIGFYFVIVQKVHLPMYVEVEQTLFPMLNIIYDQQLAGGILKITQMFSYAFALLFIMLEWGRREQEKEGTADVDHVRYIRGVVIHLDDKKQ